MHQGELLPAVTKKDLKRYEDLRENSKELIDFFQQKTHKNMIKECAKRLGMWRRGSILANTEDDFSILFDYCFFHYLINGSTIINRCFNGQLLPAEAGGLKNAWKADYYSKAS